MSAGVLSMIFLAIILVFVARIGRGKNTPSDYYVANRAFTGPQNGLALFGTYLLMTSFLALSGDVALNGYDAVLFGVSFIIAWLVALVLIAEPLRNTGRFTLGDALSIRMQERPVRMAAATVTLIVFFLYMTIQLTGAAAIVTLLLGVASPLAEAMVILLIGTATTVIVFYGGMRGTTWTQILKAGLLFVGVVALGGALLLHYRFDISTLLGDAASGAGSQSAALLTPGGKFGADTTDKLQFVSQMLTVILGHAALPYLFIRFLTTPSARETRRSVSWAIWLIVPFYVLVMLIGFGAAALVGAETIQSSPGGRLSAAPLLAEELGGVALLAFIASVVFITIIAVTAGLAISAAATFTHDIYRNIARHTPSEGQEVHTARITVVVLCVLMTVVGLLLMRQNLHFMLALNVTLVASSILPTMVYSWFWRRFNTSGVLWTMYGGLITTVVLVAFSPAVSGAPQSMLPDVDFAIFPWSYVGLVSIPLGFLYGWLGSKLSRERDDAAYAEMEIRSLSGAGADK
ncbi:solute symporter family protein [Phytoactinopolyspora limicola]|uniref:solute symporter family protein n=1 Tax=Phytoactinopolyspora limicola TaxID=2715536 RepID=UPI001408BBA3|nr:cation acetate symporter [Phytoactinopolyspora limicola]